MRGTGVLGVAQEGSLQPIEIETHNKGAGRPRSILFVSWRDLASPMAGGSELLIHQLASGLSERGYDVSLLCGGPVEPKSLYRVVDSGGQYSHMFELPFITFDRFAPRIYSSKCATACRSWRLCGVVDPPSVW